jgi:hypothetical protein
VHSFIVVQYRFIVATVQEGAGGLVCGICRKVEMPRRNFWYQQAFCTFLMA